MPDTPLCAGADFGGNSGAPGLGPRLIFLAPMCALDPTSGVRGPIWRCSARSARDPRSQFKSWWAKESSIKRGRQEGSWKEAPSVREGRAPRRKEGAFEASLRVAFNAADGIAKRGCGEVSSQETSSS